MTPGKPVEIFNAKGAGCVRHLWFVFGEGNCRSIPPQTKMSGAKIDLDDSAPLA